MDFEHSKFNAEILLRNNSPVDDFCGLTPTEIHTLLYSPFSERSPIGIREKFNDSTLDRIPFFRIAEEFFKIVQREKKIKLTPLGAIPKKVMVELYNHRFFLVEEIECGITKLWREEDCIIISSARLSTEVAGLVKRTNGKLSLTKMGTKLLLPENRLTLFKNILTSYTQKFNWGYNDRYPSYPVGQLGFGFSLYLLSQFGNVERTISFYADQYFKAFPKFIPIFIDEDHMLGERGCRQCYMLRTFDQFLEWFGLAAIKRKNSFIIGGDDSVIRTELVDQIFMFETI
jgi:hypothetical protein